MSTNTSPRLDGLDLMLIQELESNARQTSVSFAEKLNISRPTVRVKMQKLIDNNVIKILPITDPLAMGFKTRVNLGFNTLPSHVDTVAKALLGLGLVKFKQEKFPEAIECFEVLLEKNPGYICHIGVRLSEAYEFTDDTDMASRIKSEIEKNCP